MRGQTLPMRETEQTGKLTAGDRLTATLLRVAPWLAFFALALPLPVYLLLRQAGVEDVLVALVSLAAGSLAGLISVIFILLYRRRWERRLRDRLADDGVTAGELSWFKSELKPAERRALKEMEAQNPLLADAYRETLAARVTAARVLASARREAAAVERRLLHTRGLQAASRHSLETELHSDRERLARVTREATEHHAEIETRLHTIEALAARGVSEAETERAMLRLGSVREYVPVGLAAAQQQREEDEEAAKARREIGTPGTG